MRKKIEDYDNYFIYDNGDVLNTSTNKILQGSIGESGYKYYRLSKNNTKQMFYAHRLVAQYFLDNPNNLPIVNHKDGNKLNNNVDNLEWVTEKENILHGIKTGLKIYKKGKQNAMYGKFGKNSNRAIPILQFDLNNNLIKQWDSQIEIQRELGYKQSVISNCCNGRGKTAYGYIWKHKVKENK